MKSNSEKSYTGNSLTEYIKRIKEIKLLTPEEEQKLGYRILQGDIDAVNALVEANLRLVINIAIRYCNKNNLFDLIQEGNRGLMKAAKLFDVTKGYKFSTFATLNIKQAVIIASYKNSNSFELNISTIRRIYAINKFESEYEITHCRKPTNKEIAEALNYSLQSVNIVKEKLSVRTVSLDYPIGEDNTDTLEDIIKDEAFMEKSIDDKLDYQMLKQIVDLLLNEREQKIIFSRLGLDGSEAKSLEEIGKSYNLTRERIRQIEEKAYKKLRRYLLSKYPKYYKEFTLNK